MKSAIGLFVAACILSGCVSAGGNIPHDDSIAATERDQGPVLCRDGSPPPCNNRD
jgi:hypothetical protein